MANNYFFPASFYLVNSFALAGYIYILLWTFKLIRFSCDFSDYSTAGQHKARKLNPALHLVLSGQAPCFYAAAVLLRSSYIYIVLKLFSPLKATSRLMWPLVRMSLTPLDYKYFEAWASLGIHLIKVFLKSMCNSRLLRGRKGQEFLEGVQGITAIYRRLGSMM